MALRGPLPHTYVCGAEGAHLKLLHVQQWRNHIPVWFLSHVHTSFVSSTAPSTTAWMLAHCGFTAGITRRCANGKTALAPTCAGMLGGVEPFLHCLGLSVLPVLLGTQMTLGPSSREEPAVARKLLLVPQPGDASFCLPSLDPNVPCQLAS